VRDAIPCATFCAVRTAEEAVMQGIAVVVHVGAVGGQPVADAQQAHHDADGRR
jgi:hypothetical protein